MTTILATDGETHDPENCCSFCVHSLILPGLALCLDFARLNCAWARPPEQAAWGLDREVKGVEGIEVDESVAP